MKLIQLNIWYGHLKYKAIPFLKEENADIVTLQEVSGGLEGDFFYFNLVYLLKKKLGYRHSFYSKFAEGKLSGSTVSMGNMILSRYPINYKKQTLIFGKARKNSRFSSSDANITVLQHIKIKVNGKVINVLNYHGYFI